MNRNFPKFQALSEAGQREADSRNTSPEIWLACHLIESEGRTGAEIWEDPSQSEDETIQMMLNEWAIHGDIQPDTYYWGCSKIEVSDH